jgi:hypothetical protein
MTTIMSPLRMDPPKHPTLPQLLKTPENDCDPNVKGARAVKLPQPPAGVCKERTMGREESGQRPGLLADLRWEKRFVHFLELSGVGRTLADGVDEESAYAARMDTWIVWETEDAEMVERSTPRGVG